MIPRFHLRRIPSFDSRTACIPRNFEPAYAGELSLLLGKLTEVLLILDPKIPIACVKLLSVDKIGSLSSCGLLQDMELPNNDNFSAIPFIRECLTPDEHATALDLLKE